MPGGSPVVATTHPVQWQGRQVGGFQQVGAEQTNASKLAAYPPTPATVVEVANTGQVRGDGALLLMIAVDVQDQTGTYQAKGAFWTPATVAPRVAPGTSVTVHPNPANATRDFGIDWARL
jgi:hypothetical protein